MAHGKKNAFKGVSKKTETECTHVLKNREDGETQKEKKIKTVLEDTGRAMQ